MKVRRVMMMWNRVARDTREEEKTRTTGLVHTWYLTTQFLVDKNTSLISPHL